jgi:uncharacterized protein YbaA (DUF1428 family)
LRRAARACLKPWRSWFADPRIKEQMNAETMPFDGKRMFWGGFKCIVEMSAQGHVA